MNVHRFLFVCFVSGALCQRIPKTSADLPLFNATEGQSVSFAFPFTLAAGSRRYLCRAECKEEDVLIETRSSAAHSGRYSIRYHEGVLQVEITDLKTSDSGWYRCGVGGPLLLDSYEELVEIRVTEVQQEVTNSSRSVQNSSEETRDSATVALRGPERHDVEATLIFTTSITFPATTRTREQQPSETTAAHTDFTLVVGVCVAVVGVVLLTVFLLLLHKCRSKREHVGLNIEGNSDKTNTEFVTYENWAPDSRCEDSTYQSLDPSGRDQNQTYSTIVRDV